jgi:hypothetical protein
MNPGGCLSRQQAEGLDELRTQSGRGLGHGLIASTTRNPDPSQCNGGQAHYSAANRRFLIKVESEMALVDSVASATNAASIGDTLLVVSCDWSWA